MADDCDESFDGLERVRLTVEPGLAVRESNTVVCIPSASRSPLSAFRSRLSALGFPLSAFRFRLSVLSFACGGRPR